MPTQSSSGGWQCACRAFSGGEFGEDRPPIRNDQPGSGHNGRCNVYLILTPCPSSSSRCLLPVLLDTIVVTVDGIDGRVVGGSRVGRGVHLVHWGRHGNR
jgi:hypothetical protein